MQKFSTLYQNPCLFEHCTKWYSFSSEIKLTIITNNPCNELIFLIIILTTWFLLFPSEVYDESEIEEVQLAYDCDKLTQVQRKMLAARLGREHCEEIYQLSGDRPQTTVSTNKCCPCCTCCGASHFDGIEYFTEAEEEAKVEFEQRKQSLKSLGIAFVTFVNEATAVR